VIAESLIVASSRRPSLYVRLPLVVLLLSLAACGSDSNTQPSVDANAAAAVSIDATPATISLGGVLQLSASAMNSVGTILMGKAIAWQSSRPDVATITSTGLVSGISVGTAVISAKSDGKSQSITLTVRQGTQITLTGDAGDLIVGSETYSYTNSNAFISLTATNSTIQVQINGDQHWTGSFQVPSGTQLAPGTYSNSTRFPALGNAASLSWQGEGRGCSTLTGSFSIDSMSGSSVSLTALDMHFEQHCEGITPALHGTIHWRADDKSGPPGPVNPLPVGLWQPAAGAVPATGDVVYLQSEQGDLIGGGQTDLYLAGIAVSNVAARMSVSVDGWEGNFQGMSSIPILTVGYYGDMSRYPFNNPFKGGLDWSGHGIGCATLTGWFVVDRVNYVNTVLKGIQLRFEQHCEGFAPALHGLVRWGQLGS
jgi:hypothetical protein